MNYEYFDNVFSSAGHFLGTFASFASGSFGYLFVGLVVLLVIVSLFNALRS